MELVAQEWLRLLSKDYPPAEETLVFAGGLRRPYTLSIRKTDWKERFPGFGGMAFRKGREVQLVTKAVGGNGAELPTWVVDQLGLAPVGQVCVTKRSNRFYLKRFDLLERGGEMPGWLVIDKFDRAVVTRTYSNRPDIDAISYSRLNELLSRMGRFRHDPVTPLMQMDGRIGLLARKELVGGFSRADRDTIRAYRKQIAAGQQGNGSWEDNPVKTAFNLIRLIEVGGSMKHRPVARAAGWLLSAPEPVGLPGMFMWSEDFLARFNAWKAARDRGKIPQSWTKPPEKRQFLDNLDVLPNVLEASCETKTTFPSAVAVEALLRCGLEGRRRVIRAINTLLTLRGGEGRWCGCGYLKAHVDVPDSTAAVDFDRRLPVPRQNDEVYMLDWFLQRKDLLRFVHGRSWSSEFHGVDYAGLDVGDGRALLVKHFRTMGACTLLVHRALSFHSKYHGSNLEATAALECSYRQGADGNWGDAHLPCMFDVLGRFRHPLAAFLMLRSVPLLIRRQKADGLWELPARLYDRRARGAYSLPREVGGFMIVRALKTFGYLDALRPR